MYLVELKKKECRDTSHKHKGSRQIGKGHALTPTSRNLTSRQTAPKSFMRLSANSRKFPEFSHPLVTRGKGISLQQCPSTDIHLTRIKVKDRTSVLCKPLSKEGQVQVSEQQHQPKHLQYNFYIVPSARAHKVRYRE